MMTSFTRIIVVFAILRQALDFRNKRRLTSAARPRLVFDVVYHGAGTARA